MNDNAALQAGAEQRRRVRRDKITVSGPGAGGPIWPRSEQAT